MAEAVAITCRGVSKRFALVDAGNAWRIAFGLQAGLPSFQALSDVSLDVPKGQFVGVLGRNGAGKSTLLRVIGGVYAADAGSVSVRGALSALYELGLAGNPQLTGRQYADRVLAVHGFSRRERAAMADEVRDFSELGDRYEDPVVTYSAGMSARLFFSTATAGSYEVYLLDEILSVGDQHFQAKCWRRLRERIAGGASGLLVTHDWAAVVRLCETAHILDRGRITFSGPAPRAVRAYLYGDAGRESFVEGIARIAQRPQGPILARQSEDLRLELEAEILKPGAVLAVAVIERLQPGFGWETMLMSRAPQPVGEAPGRYRVEILIPRLPIAAGRYQIAVHLVAPDPGTPGRRLLLDGFTWLNGDGLALEVEAAAGCEAMALPMRWRVAADAAAEANA